MSAFPTAFARRLNFMPKPRRMSLMSSSRFLVLRRHFEKRLLSFLFSKRRVLIVVLREAIVGSLGTTSSSSLLSNCPGGHRITGGFLNLLILSGWDDDSACSFSLGVSLGLRAFPYPPFGFSHTNYGEARVGKRTSGGYRRARIRVENYIARGRYKRALVLLSFL